MSVTGPISAALCLDLETLQQSRDHVTAACSQSQSVLSRTDQSGKSIVMADQQEGGSPGAGDCHNVVTPAALQGPAGTPSH